MTNNTPTTLAELVTFFLSIINSIIPLLIGAAFLVIIWKMFDAWIFHASDSAKVEEGKTVAITGVIVMVVMLSVWGILNLLITSIIN